MKNKHHCDVKYVLAKNVRSNVNSIIHNWILMLLAGICGTTAGAGCAVKRYKDEMKTGGCYY